MNRRATPKEAVESRAFRLLLLVEQEYTIERACAEIPISSGCFYAQLRRWKSARPDLYARYLRVVGLTCDRCGKMFRQGEGVTRLEHAEGESVVFDMRWCSEDCQQAWDREEAEGI